MVRRSATTDVEFRIGRDWRWFVGGTGKILIALGVLTFGFVGYQLWGTGIETALAQQRLEDDFNDLLAAADQPTDASIRAGTFEKSTAPTIITPDSGEATPTTSTIDTNSSRNDGLDPEVEPDDIESNGIETNEVETVDSQPSDSTNVPVPVAEQRLPELTDGSALARLEIPAIGIDNIVVAGIGVSDLKAGPGHFPDTPLPGQLGNSAIAGHRTTYGAPFFDVDQLVAGDEMIVTTLEGRFVYQVSDQQIVKPSAYEVVATSDPTRASLTLVSCDPKWTARNRIIVTGVLSPDRSASVGEPLLNYGRPAVPSSANTGVGGEVRTESDVVTVDREGNEPTIDVQTEINGSSNTSGSLADLPQPVPALSDSGSTSALAEAFEQGWFSDPGANRHVAAWGALLAAISLAAWQLSRRTGRNLVGGTVGLVPFIVTLFFFYQNVNRLLPPGL